MLAIRMQRTGRKGHAMFRVIVQESRFAPTSGKVVAALGSYDPHSKAVILDKEKAGYYLNNGAQPSDRVARLLKAEGVKLPAWVKEATKKEGDIRNPDKRRSTRPEGAEAPVAEEAPAAEVEAEAPAEETVEPAEEAPATEEAETTPEETAPAEPEAPAEAEAPAEPESPAEEAPAEEKPAEPEAEVTEPEAEPEEPKG